jgi:hypothetical protein
VGLAVGRKLKGKSARELRSLGLVVDADEGTQVDPNLERPRRIARRRANGYSSRPDDPQKAPGRI